MFWLKSCRAGANLKREMRVTETCVRSDEQGFLNGKSFRWTSDVPSAKADRPQGMDLRPL
jgi:hypothetical protein